MIDMLMEELLINPTSLNLMMMHFIMMVLEDKEEEDLESSDAD